MIKAEINIENQQGNNMRNFMSKMMSKQHAPQQQQAIQDLAATLGPQREKLQKSTEDLMKWIQAGENEVYLRQMIDATLSETQTGYSIAHFDFLIYFKHKQVKENFSEEPLKYLRRLILSEFCVKVKTNTKYLNFHRRHDAMIKLWQQMVRVISFESTLSGTQLSGVKQKEEEEEEMFNASDDEEEAAKNTRAAIEEFKRKRIAIIRNYMMYCQNHQQSKTQQCNDLRKIFISLWNIEAAQEKIEGGDVSALSLLAFCRLWNTRYNTQNRIVINASDEQLEARAMFCHSANALLQYFNYFNKSPLSDRSLAAMCDQMRHFIATNNNANNYNVNVQMLSNPFRNKRFGFSKQTFITDVLPTIRTCMASLSRVSQLQGNIYLSLYESFWDVSYIIQYFNMIVCLLDANNFEVENSPLLEMDLSAANNMAGAPPTMLKKRRKKLRKLSGGQDSKKSKKLLKRIKRLIE